MEEYILGYGNIHVYCELDIVTGGTETSGTYFLLGAYIEYFHNCT
jgi:hypothetical protein